MDNPAKNHLPKVVGMISDRIGLDYNIRPKQATEIYISKQNRLELKNLKNSYYSLTEGKTKKSGDDVKQKIPQAKNPLKLNCEIRKKLYKLTPDEKHRLKYRDFEKIHKLWSEYAQKVMANNDLTNVFRMDLHGCLLKCTASKNPTFVGQEGFVVQDTKNTFLLVNRTNRIVTLPKKESVFEFNVDQKLYRVRGCNFLFTTQARTKVKYKQKRSNLDV